MKLLVVTQAVDTTDPVLGFFHRWVEEIAKHFEHVDVICLKEGTHSLPDNVSVHSLGKEFGPSRVKYITRFYTLIRSLQYDSVFVHMNEEYVLLGGLYWKLRKIPVVLWRNHKIGSWRTDIACSFVRTVCHTSPAAYVAHKSNAALMPIGIDTDIFRPREIAPDRTILFLGRLDAVKNVHIFIAALSSVYEQGQRFIATIIGSPTDPISKYAHDVRNQAAELALEGAIVMKEAVPNSEAASVFASNAIYVNLTPSGSFDKTIGEAMASGCIVVTGNDAMKSVLQDELFVATETSEDAARAISYALSLSPDERARIGDRLRQHILKEHSLSLLVTRLFEILRV